MIYCSLDLFVGSFPTSTTFFCLAPLLHLVVEHFTLPHRIRQTYGAAATLIFNRFESRQNLILCESYSTKCSPNKNPFIFIFFLTENCVQPRLFTLQIKTLVFFVLLPRKFNKVKIYALIMNIHWNWENRSNQNQNAKESETIDKMLQ